MNKIEVPFLPISNFDTSTVSQYFPETEIDNESNDSLIPAGNTFDGEELSEEIALILIGMGMEKYLDLFQKQHILIDTFLQLSDTDLEEVGITDPKDREIISKNLSIHQSIPKECIIPENHAEDLVIVQNVSHQLLLLKNYCAYIELQMKKYKFTDYKINSEEFACTYLKAFTEAALLQSKILCNSVYGEQNFDSLIDKILKKNNMILPQDLENSLPKRKKKKLNFGVRTVVVIGLSSLVILLGIYRLHS